jgi:hypothetical protein
MKALIIAAVAASALSAGAVGAQAQNETDKAMGAGSYIHPNGPSQEVWTDSGSRLSYAGAVGTR